MAIVLSHFIKLSISSSGTRTRIPTTKSADESFFFGAFSGLHSLVGFSISIYLGALLLARVTTRESSPASWMILVVGYRDYTANQHELLTQLVFLSLTRYTKGACALLNQKGKEMKKLILTLAVAAYSPFVLAAGETSSAWQEKYHAYAQSIGDATMLTASTLPGLKERVKITPLDREYIDFSSTYGDGTPPSFNDWLAARSSK